MKKISKKIISLSLALVLAASSTTTYGSLVTTARRISIFELTGNYVTMERGTTSTTPRVGQRLVSGSVIHTGNNSSAYLRLDEESLVLVDQNSQVAVSSSRDLLTLDVQDGNALVHIAEQRQGAQTRTRAGNVGLTVRGTMYTVGVSQTGSAVIVMLSGYAELDNGRYLREGHMLLQDAEEELYVVIVPINVNELNLFTIESILANQSYLLENSGFVTEELLEEVEHVREMIVERGNAGSSQLPVVVMPPVVEDGGSNDDSGNDNDNNDIDEETDTDEETCTDEDNYINEESCTDTDCEIPEINGVYLISNSSQLVTLAALSTSSGFAYSPLNQPDSILRLANDITLNANVSIRGEFVATFDGNGHTITLGGGTPLFDELAPSATVNDLVIRANNPMSGAALANINHGHIDGVELSDVVVASRGGNYYNVGGIVIKNHGTISRSANNSLYAAGINITAPNHTVGGIASNNSGTIEYSFSATNISASGASTVGGIAGTNAGTIRHSYSTGILTGGDVGGIAGASTSQGIHAVFSVSPITAISRAGGIVAFHSGATISRAVALNQSVTGAISGLIYAEGNGSSSTYVFAHGGITHDENTGNFGENGILVSGIETDDPAWWHDELEWPQEIWDISTYGGLPWLRHPFRVPQPFMQKPLTLTPVVYVYELKPCSEDCTCEYLCLCCEYYNCQDECESESESETESEYETEYEYETDSESESSDYEYKEDETEADTDNSYTQEGDSESEDETEDDTSSDYQESDSSNDLKSEDEEENDSSDEPQTEESNSNEPDVAKEPEEESYSQSQEGSSNETETAGNTYNATYN